MSTVNDPADDPFELARSVGIPEADLPRSAPELRRRVALEGGYNFRDLGGYRTVDGSMTRWGTLFRSDHLNELTDADVQMVHRLGLKRVHDFRLDSERERQPSRLPEGLEVMHLGAADMGIDAAMVDVVRDMLEGRRQLPEPTYWDDNYEDMVRRAHPMFSALMTSITLEREDSVPSLFHCTGGKDRTGIAGVLVLEIAGVDRETAIDDFLLTNLYRTPHRAIVLKPRLEQVGVAMADALPILGVTRSAIERALSIIDTEYGGPQRYVVSGGAPSDVADRLRAYFVGG